MASSSTNKTVWTIVLVVVFLFLVWKLWPVLNAALSGGGSSGGAVGGATGFDEGDFGQPYYIPSQQSPLQSLLSSIPGLGSLFGGGGGGPTLASSTNSGLSSVLSEVSSGQLDAASAATDATQLISSEDFDNASLLSPIESGELSGDSAEAQAPQDFDDSAWEQGYTPDDSDDDSGDTGS
jgi:hypothetical protein